MLINFDLAPIEEVVLRASSHRQLSWYELTDGKYWIQTGEVALLEYSDDAQNFGAGRYCDYYVARLYQDLMEMLPFILEPVPEALTQYLWGESTVTWSKNVNSWIDKNSDVLDEERFDEIYEYAVSWRRERFLQTSYLSPSAEIVIWSDEEHVHIGWDNRENLFDGKLAWSAIFDSYKLPRNEFIEEIKDFHFYLMEEMAARFMQFQKTDMIKKVEVDLSLLTKEAELYKSDFDARLSFLPKTNWKEIEKAIGEICRA